MQDGPRWDVSPLPGPPAVPGYALGAPLGAGGFGTVYSATDGAGRQVAVKLLTAATPSAQARFEREAELLARLRHPGVVVVHGWGRTGPAAAPVSYLVCERIEGRPLDVAAADLDLDGRLALVEQAARAAGAVHALGIVHRDLKPQNILVDGAGRVKVIDFGVSLGEGVERLTKTGQFLGTPLYAPPERLLDDPAADAPTGDVWALAAIAYELVAGAHPYPVETVVDLVRRADGPPPSPRRLAPALDRGVAELLVRALSPRPADRPPDGAAFAEELGAARAGRGRRARHAVAALSALALASVALAGAALARAGRDAAPPPAAADPAAAEDLAARVTSAAALLARGEAAAVLSLADAIPGPDGQRLRAQALARLERWAEARALLAAPGGDLALARLRGLAALHLGDLEAAARELSPEEPQLVVARALARAAALDPAPAAAAATLLECVEEAVDAARRLDDGPGARATRARAQAAARDTLLLLRPPDDPAGFERRGALAAAAARLQDDPDARRGLEAALWWVEFTRGVPLQAGPARDWLRERAPSCPSPGPWDLTQPTPIRALVRSVELAGAQWVPGPPFDEAALADALALLPALDGLGPAGVGLERAAGKSAALASRDAACRALRRGETAEAGRHLARANGMVRALEEGPAIGPREKEDGVLVASLHLVSGRFSQARAVLTETEGGVAVVVLRIESDLMAGGLDAAARRIEALARRPDLARFAIEGLVVRLDLHRQVLAGELSPAEAARRLPADPTPPPRVGSLHLEWHTRDGLADVLAGGWWPGKGGRAGR